MKLAPIPHTGRKSSATGNRSSTAFLVYEEKAVIPLQGSKKLIINEPRLGSNKEVQGPIPCISIRRKLSSGLPRKDNEK